MEKKTVESKKRKSAENRVSKENHEPTSEMHQAITMRDKEWVKKLLDKGETLCNRREEYSYRGFFENCFILAHSFRVDSWDFMKFLLSVDPDAGVTARNSTGLTLLMLYAKYHKVEEVKQLLELGADPEDICDDGNTALTLALSIDLQIPVSEQEEKLPASLFTVVRKSYHEKFQNIVDLMIEKGADVSIRNKNGENALHIAAKNKYVFHLEILQSLINAGADSTVETRERCTVLSYAMKTFVELCKEFENDTLAKELYQALHYLFRLAPFQGDTFQLRCDVEMHPQVTLLKHLSLFRRLTGNQSICIDLFTGTTILDPDLVFMDYIQYARQVSPEHSLDHNKLPFGPLALYLNYEQYSYKSRTAPMVLTFFGRYLI